MKLKKYIAYCIVSAQMASDAGKRITDAEEGAIVYSKKKKQEHSIKSSRYRAKDGFILDAINAINKNPRCGYNYYVVWGKDQNGNPSSIVYFDFKIDNKRKQVSFHTFNGYIRLYAGRGRKTRWDHDLGGSREASRLLAEKYNF